MYNFIFNYKKRTNEHHDTNVPRSLM